MSVGGEKASQITKQ